MLMDELKKYVNPTAKIRRIVKAGELVPKIGRASCRVTV